MATLHTSTGAQWRKWPRLWTNARTNEPAQQMRLHGDSGVSIGNEANESNPSPCSTLNQRRKEQLKYRWTIILSLCLPLSLSSLDMTIVASALPWIAADFNQVHQMNWIISVFNLTSAAFIPLWGQAAELFGRYWSIQACMALIIIGSAFNTSAPIDAFPLLIVGRAIQGLGSAGMEIIIRAIVADRVSLEADAKTWSIFSIVSGISYAIGPILGGYLTNANWRWCFGINLPLGVISILVVFIFLRQRLVGPQPIPGLDDTSHTERNNLLKFIKRCQTVDFGGQVLSVLGLGLLILGFTWAGATYRWKSLAVLLPLALGIVTLAGFLTWEYFMSSGRALAKRFPHKRPIISWEVFTTKDIGLLFYLSFSSGMAIFSVSYILFMSKTTHSQPMPVLYFCNLYFTIVKQLGPDDAGKQLLFLIPGIGVGVMVASVMCTKTPRQTWHPLALGAVFEALGIVLLAWAFWMENDSVGCAMMSMIGFGTGLRLMPVSLHAMAYFPQRKSSIISLVELSNPLGGAIGLTIMTTVFNNVVGVDSASDLLQRLNTSLQASDTNLAKAAKKGIVAAYMGVLPFTILCVILSCFLGNVYIDRNTQEGGEKVIYRGAYILARLRGADPKATVREAATFENAGVDSVWSPASMVAGSECRA